MRTTAHQFGSGGEEIVVAFQRKEPRDLADDEIVRVQAETFSQSGIVGGREKRREGKAAEDAGVLFAPSDPGGEILFGHRVGDADEMSGVTGGKLFGGTK